MPRPNFTYQFQWNPQAHPLADGGLKLSGQATILKLYHNLEREEILNCLLTIDPASFHMENIQSHDLRLNNDQGEETVVSRAFKIWANGIYQGRCLRPDCWANW